jgi:hypothetical protein
MKSLITRLWQEEEGQDLTQYGLLLEPIPRAAASSLTCDACYCDL